MALFMARQRQIHSRTEARAVTQYTDSKGTPRHEQLRQRPHQRDDATTRAWMQRILMGLFGLYVIELMASNIGLPVGALAWRPVGMGFSPHQLLTRFLVQGNSVFSVLISLLVLYFFLPAIDQLYARRQVIQSLVCAVAAAAPRSRCSST